MELWIRSQDKEKLIKAKHMEIMNGTIRVIDTPISIPVGNYWKPERAKEILNEIQDLIQGKTIIETKALLRPDDAKKLMEEYGATMIETPTATIKQLPNAIIYEMPKE